MNSRVLKFTITVKVEKDDAAAFPYQEAQTLANDSADIIRNRLFGEGFLPHDVLIDDWRMESEVIG